MALRDIPGLVSSAYGGMRYRNDTPPDHKIGTAWEQITLFDESLPLIGKPRCVYFDSEDKSVQIDPNEDGVYDVSTYVNFQGEPGEVYTIEFFIDQGDSKGPQPSGAPIFARVSSQDPYQIAQRSVIAQIKGGWIFTLWVKSNKIDTTFNIFVASLQFVRVSQRIIP